MGRKEGGSLFHQFIQTPGLFFLLYRRRADGSLIPVAFSSRKLYLKELHLAAGYFTKLGISRLDQIGKEEVQAYELYLEGAKKTASTIHNYLAPICKLLGIPMDEIKKPLRHAADFNRSHGGGPTYGGPPGELNAMVGLRRHDLQRLHGNDLLEKDGNTYIIVDKSKGGKYQEQKVLPQYVHAVKAFFDGSDRLLFKPKDLVYGFDYHGQRRAVAQEAIEYYTRRLRNEPGYRKKLYRELAGQWHAYNKKNRNRLEPLCFFDKPYILRGRNRDAALAQGKAVILDRLALRAVSILHLSHWRDGVTVQSYYLDRGRSAGGQETQRQTIRQASCCDF